MFFGRSGVEYAFLNLSRLQSHLVSQMLRDTAAELMNTPQELMEKGEDLLWLKGDYESVYLCVFGLSEHLEVSPIVFEFVT